MRRSIVVLLVLAALTTSAAYADSANNVLRFGVGWFDPDAESTINDGASTIDFSADSATAYFVDYERRLIPWLGLDFEVNYAKPDFVATIGGGGGTATDSEAIITGSAGVNFHFLARSRVDFYAGAYAAWATFDDSFEDTFGYGALIGLDIGITKSGLAITGSVRYTQLEADVTGLNGQSVAFDPLLYQLGLGWRF